MRFVKGGIVLLVVATLFYLGIFFVLNKVEIAGKPLIFSMNKDLIWEGGNSYDRYREFSTDEHYDIILMGSSHAYRGFDPRIFEEHGLNMFNIGSSAQAIDDTEILLKELVNPDKVDLVVVEISPMSFTADPAESSAYLITNVPQENVAIEVAKNRWGMKSFNLYTQRLMRKSAAEPLYESNDYVGKGYCEKFDSLETLPDFVQFKRYKPKDHFVDAFKGMISYAQEKKIELIFVTQPLPKEMDQSIFPLFYEVVQESIQSTNIRYMDYAFKLPLSSLNHFYDHSHLNQSGVDIFNEQFIADLKTLKILD